MNIISPDSVSLAHSSKQRASIARRVFQLMRENYEKSKRLSIPGRYHALKTILTTATSEPVIERLLSLSRDHRDVRLGRMNLSECETELEALFRHGPGHSGKTARPRRDSTTYNFLDTRTPKSPISRLTHALAKLVRSTKKGKQQRKRKMATYSTSSQSSKKVSLDSLSMTDSSLGLSTRGTSCSDQCTLRGDVCPEKVPDADVTRTQKPRGPKYSFISINSLSTSISAWLQGSETQWTLEESKSPNQFNLAKPRKIIPDPLPSLTASAGKVKASILGSSLTPSPSHYSRDLEKRLIRSDQIPEFHIPSRVERRRRISRTGRHSPEVVSASLSSQARSTPCKSELPSPHSPAGTNSPFSKQPAVSPAQVFSFDLPCVISLMSQSSSGERLPSTSEDMSYATLETVHSEETFFPKPGRQASVTVFATEMEELSIKIAYELLEELRQEFDALKGKNILWQYRKMKQILKTCICAII